MQIRQQEEARRMARRGAGLLVITGLMALIGALPAGAQTTVPTQMGGSSGQVTPTNLSAMQGEALGWLQQLIRFDTTNPPGNELVEAKYISDILAKEGIHSEIFESTPGRGFLVARLQANALPDSSRALLLMAHLDVVGVDKSKWTVDPFGAVIKDGYLYGRGAVDDKGMLAENLAVFIALKRFGLRLNRDVIFLAEGDEEAGGENGIKFAIEKHWDKIAAGFALNEGGQAIVDKGKVQFVGVQASEKVALNVDVIATGTAGHASIPRQDDAVVHLAEALDKIAGYETPVQFNSVTRAYFEGLAGVEDEETSKWMRALETPD